MTALAISTDSTRIVTGDALGRISMWNLTTGKLVETKTESSAAITAVVFTPDGSGIISAVRDEIRRWEIANQKKYPALAAQKDKTFTSLALSVDGRFLAAGDRAGTLYVWDVRKWEKVWECAAHTQGISALWLSANGDTLATASLDFTMKLWDVNKKTILKTFGAHEGHRRKVTAVAFTPNAKEVITADEDG